MARMGRFAWVPCKHPSMACRHFSAGEQRRLPFNWNNAVPFLQKTQLLPYSWTEQGAMMPGINYPIDHATAGTLCLSQGKWNSREDSGWASLLT